MDKLVQDAIKIINHSAGPAEVAAFKKAAIPVAIYYVSNRLPVDADGAAVFTALFRLGVF